MIAAGLDREGKLVNAGDVSISSDQVGLHGQTLAGGNLKVQAQSNIDAAKGQLQAQNIELGECNWQHFYTSWKRSCQRSTQTS